MIPACDISCYIISEYQKKDAKITNLKLQKVLYYIQGYALRDCGEAAFSEPIYRWPYGPVVPDAYYKYNVYRNKPLEVGEVFTSQNITKKIERDPGLRKVIGKVVKSSIPKTAAELVRMTHAETPWQSVAEFQEIPAASIANYFLFHDPLKIEEPEGVHCGSK